MSAARTIRILGIVAIALLVIIVGLSVAVRIAFPPEEIRRRAESALQEALDRPVGIREAGVRLFPRVGATVGGVTIANASGQAFSRQPMLTLERGILSVDLLQLLWGKLVLTRVALRSPAILIETAADGTSNLEGLGGRDTAADGSLPFPLRVETIRITDGRITFRNAADSLFLRLGGISQRLRLDIRGRPPVVRTRGISTIRTVRTAEGAAPISDLPLRIRHSAVVDPTTGLVRLDTVAARMGESVLGAAGILATSDLSRRIDMLFDAVLERAALNAAIGSRLIEGGSVKLHGTIEGPLGEGLDAGRIAATARLIDLTAGWAGSAVPVVLNGELRADNDTARADIAARAGRSRATLTAVLTQIFAAVTQQSVSNLPRLTFAVQSPLIDMEELTTPRSDTQSPTRRDAADTLPLLTAPLLPLSAEGTISVDTLEYRSVVMRNVRGTAAGDTGRAEVSLQGDYAGGRLQTDMRTGIGPDGIPMVNQSLLLNGVSVRRMLLDFLSRSPSESRLITALRAGGVPVDGTGDFDMQMSARGPTQADILRTVNALITAVVWGGEVDRRPAVVDMLKVVEHLAGQPLSSDFDTLRARLRVDTASVLVDTLLIDAPFGLWIVEGTIGLGGRLDLAVVNHLSTPLSKTLLGLKQTKPDLIPDVGEGIVGDMLGALGSGPVPVDPDGRVSLRFSVQGSVEDPVVGFAGLGAPGINPTGAQERIRKEHEDIRRRFEDRLDSLDKGLRDKALPQIPGLFR